MFEQIDNDIRRRLSLFSPRALAINGVEHALAHIYEPPEAFASTRNWHNGYSGLVDFNGNPAPLSRSAFINDADYLCIGCSFSVASGLPECYSWPSLLREFTGKSVNNISQPGTGYSYIAFSALDVIHNFGKPKKIYVLLPDPFRLWLRSPPVEVGSVEWPIRHLFYDKARRTYIDPVRQGKKLSPAYIDANGKKHLIDPNYVAQHNLQMMRIFESIVDLLAIDFSFTTWTQHTVFNKENYFKSYIEAPNSFKTRYCGETLENARTLIHERWRNYGVPIGHNKHETNQLESIVDVGDDYLDDVWDIPEVREKLGEKILMCDHSPCSKHQENFWSVGSDGIHPGLHDQIHFAEHLLQQSIPGTFLKQIP